MKNLTHKDDDLTMTLRTSLLNVGVCSSSFDLGRFPPSTAPALFLTMRSVDENLFDEAFLPIKAALLLHRRKRSHLFQRPRRTATAD